MRLSLRWRYGAIVSLVAVICAVGACTPTEREYAAGGAGGAGGQGGGCPAGYAECDGDLDTVCETDTTRSSEHCGTCENACSTAPYANVACVAGMCAVESCTEARENCDNFLENGCETNPSNAFEHCGGCGQSCEAPNAITACVTGTCQLAQCVSGYLDCDMNPLTGCEVDPKVSVEHCGGCNAPCVKPNATMECANSQCAIVACNPNFGDCDGQPDNGCETDLTTSPYNCNGCGNSCGGGLCNAGVCNTPTMIGMVPFAAGKMTLFKEDLYVGALAAPGDIVRIYLPNGSMSTIAAVNAMANEIHIDQNYLFVASAAGLWRFNFDGSNPFQYNPTNTRAVETDATNAYWTASASIRMIPILGGVTTTLFGGPTTSYGLTKDTQNMYVSFGTGGIFSAPIGSSGFVQIAAGPPISTNNLIVDGPSIYWATMDGIKSAPIAGGPQLPPITLATTTNSVRQIAIDTKHVYWTEETGGLVQRVAKSGMIAPEVLAIDQLGVHGIAVDDSFVYWSNSGNGEIKKIAK